MTLVFLLGAALVGAALLLVGSYVQQRVTDPKHPTETDVREAIKMGNTVKAIRLYRRVYGGGVKQAKEAIERYEAELYVRSFRGVK